MTQHLVKTITIKDETGNTFILKYYAGLTRAQNLCTISIEKYFMQKICEREVAYCFNINLEECIKTAEMLADFTVTPITLHDVIHDLNIQGLSYICNERTS